MNKYVSIDIGGTAIKYGIIYEDAEIICKRSMKTEAWKGGPGHFAESNRNRGRNEAGGAGGD